MAVLSLAGRMLLPLRVAVARCYQVCLGSHMNSTPTIGIHGPAVREIRKRTGLGVQALADAASVSRPYIARIETGSSVRVSPVVFAAIAEALHIEDRRAIMLNPAAEAEVAA